MTQWDKFGTLTLNGTRKESTVGTVTKRVGKDGVESWQVKIRMKGVSLTDTFTKESDAKKWMTTKEADIINGVSVDAHKVRKTLLKDIFLEYIKDGKMPDGKKITPNKTLALKVLIKELGNVRLENFTTKSFGLYLDHKLSQKIPPQARKKKEHPLYNGGKVLVDGKWEEKTYKPGTIRKYYYHIKTALEWHAKVNDYVFNSKPFDDNHPPGAWDSPRERIIDNDELERLLKATDKMYVNQKALKEIILFQIYSCMRMGEALKLRWSDIHFNEKEPSSSYIFIPKEHQKTRAKKSVFDRFVPLQPDFVKLVKDHILPRRGNAKDNQLVFPYWKSSTTFYSRFKVICKNANVVDAHPHDLRHTGISWYFANTLLSDIEIMKITGHIEFKTLSLYTKLRPKNVGAKIWNGLNGEAPKHHNDLMLATT